MLFNIIKKTFFIFSFCLVTLIANSVVPAHADFNKIKIAVLDFELKGKGYETEDMGSIVAEWFTTALVNTGRFDVIERAMLNKILEEQRLGLTGVVDASSASQLGKVLGVKTIISGSVLKLRNVLEVNARIIDVESASIIAAENVKSTSSTSLQNLIEQMASIIIKNFPLEGYVVNRTGKKITIDLGELAGVRDDMEFIVYREGNVIKHPKTGEILDVEQIESGRIQITSVRDKIATGKIIKEAGPGSIKYGHFVKSVAKLSPAPKVNYASPSPGGTMADSSSLIRKLNSQSSFDKKYVGQTVYRQGTQDPAVYDAIEQELLSHYQDGSGDDLHIDALAWLCKALSRSNDPQHKITLEKISREAYSDKLRKYATQSLLVNSPNKGGNSILIKKLHSNNSADKRYVGKVVYRKGARNPAVYDAIEEELLKQYKKRSGDNLHIDALAWLCKALGRSGNPKYRSTLEEISREAPNGKLRGYAEKSLSHL